jgi:septal ring factor EnvC (AmiA/AmiB activator)
LLVAALHCAAVQGAQTPEPDAAQARRLAELRERIERLKTRLEDQETVRREARDALRGSERAISEANRALAQLDAQERALRDEARRLGQRRVRLESALDTKQSMLGRVVAARYAGGSQNAIRIMLSGEDPGEIARRLHYFSHVTRAASDLVVAVRQGIAESQRLREEALQQAARLSALEAARRADRSRLVAERRERRRQLDRLAGDIRAGRREMKLLVADQARLARLVAEIGKVLASTSSAYAERVEKVAPLGAARGSFAALRGKLRLPVRGELSGRFGSPRQGAGGAKGLFIRAAEGQPVRSVASGQVVYADWMRGLGNVLIVDHGESYMSIYANNEALLKQVGDIVAMGDTIATVGASGGNEQTGLYFELRHLGIAFDPLRWVALK